MGPLQTYSLPVSDGVVQTNAVAVYIKPPSPSFQLTFPDKCVDTPGNGQSMSRRTNIPELLENAYLKLDKHLDKHARLKHGKWKDLRLEGVAAAKLGGTQG